MAETQLTDAEVEAIQATQTSGESSAGAGDGAFQYALPNESYTKKMTRQEHKQLLMTYVANRGRVFQDGTLTFGVESIEWYNADAIVTKAAAAAQALTNNATNYIYYTQSGTLTVNTTGFPVPSVTPHIPLATILTASGTYAYGDITDKRQSGFLTPVGAEAVKETTVYNGTGAQIDAGKLICAKGWDATNSCYEVELADADTTLKPGQFIASANIADSATGQAVDVYDLTGQNTSAGAVGDPVYLSTTAGGWTLTAPTGADQIQQEIGYVTVDHASTGAIRFIVNLTGNTEQIGTSGLQALAVTAAKLATDAAETAKVKNAAITNAKLNADVSGKGISGGAGTALALDINSSDAAAVDVANDSIAILDATDSASKKESIADLATAMAGAGIAATNGVLSVGDLYGEMYQEANAVATTISTADIWHATVNFSTGEVSGFTFDAGSTGPIASIADAGGGDITVNDVAHGLSAGEMVSIVGTTNYNGLYEVKTAVADSFTVTAAWGVNETGTWIQGSSLTADSGSAGIYKAEWGASIAMAVGNEIFTTCFAKNTTPCTKCRSRVADPGLGDYTHTGGSALATVADGDILYLITKNIGNTGNITFRHSNINFKRLKKT